MYIIIATGEKPIVTYTLSKAYEIICGLLTDEYDSTSICNRILEEQAEEEYSLWLIGRYEVRLYYKVEKR